MAHTGILQLLLALSNELPLSNVTTQFRDFSLNFLNGAVQITDTTCFQSEYDFIVVGAGTPGCVISNRLSENPEWSVLLLEAGIEENFLHDIPLAAVAFQRTAGSIWEYPTEPQKTTCQGNPDGVCHIVKGRALGGSSILNFMTFTRAHQSSFNGWAQDGNYGWSCPEVLPYFLKEERSYVKLSQSTYETPLLKSFLNAAKDFGYSVIDPFDKILSGFFKTPATIQNGLRYSAARYYLQPVKNRINLHISKNSLVTKVLINPDTKSAYGVEFVKDGVCHRVHAKKEVILSAGVISSSQLLMLSGVGPSQHLESLSIPVIKSLNVGYNLHDQYCYTNINFRLNQPYTIHPTKTTSEVISEYLTNHTGPVAVPCGYEALAFVKTPSSDHPTDYPDVQYVLGTVSLNQNTIDKSMQLLGLPKVLQGSDVMVVPENDTFNLVLLQLDQKSRGRIFLKSANPFDLPGVDPNYFDDPRDFVTVIEGIKLAIQIGESNQFRKYGSCLDRTPVPGCEHLDFGSDEYWKCTIVKQDGINTGVHMGGTCKMGPKQDTTAVVDPELRVYGISKLRVADASIIPKPFVGIPDGVMFMIGEKASDLIKASWGCSNYKCACRANLNQSIILRRKTELPKRHIFT